MFVVLAVLLLCAAHILWIHIYWRWKKIPYVVAKPLMATLKLLSLKMSIGTLMYDLYKKTSQPYLGFHMVGNRGMLIKDVALIKRILVKDFNYFCDRTMVTNFHDDPIGTKTLFVLKNPEWKFVRSKVSHSFSRNMIKSMFPAMENVADNLVAHTRKCVDKPVQVNEICSLYAIDVIINSAFGQDSNCFKDEKALSREAAEKIFAYNFIRGIQFNGFFLTPYLVKLFKMKWLDPLSSAYVTKLFWDIKKRKEKEGGSRDFMSTLVDLFNMKVYHTEPDEIIAQAAQFFLAGFETTVSQMSFVLYELSKNPDIQDRLRKEITDIVTENNGDLFKSLSSMTYLTMVLNESLRKYPIAPFLDRKTVKDYIIPGTDCTIDAGTNVYISVRGLHEDPKFFPDPLKFDPERFSPENRDEVEHFAYLPFGHGPRNCIGERFGKTSVMTGLVKILTNFQILPTHYKGVEFDSKGFLTSPVDPITLIFEEVNSNK